MRAVRCACSALDVVRSQGVCWVVAPSDGMAPRGLKQLLQKSAPGRFCRGKIQGFRAVDAEGKYEGPTLSGITKKLTERLYSKGEISMTGGGGWVPAAWRGADGGRRRGSAVDHQVSRLAAMGKQARQNASKYKFTSLAFAALEQAGLEPLMGQRVVISKQLGIATACDVVCYSKDRNALVVVELKTGFAGDRTRAAVHQRKTQKMKSPCSTALDSTLHRHLAQLTATRHMLASETTLRAALKSKFEISTIEGALLYVCDADMQFHSLPDWWSRRGKALIAALA